MMTIRYQSISLPEPIEMAPAPRFMSETGGPSLATIYMGHFNRMTAVINAARTGDPILIRLALENHEKHGTGE